jgi:hypothetical protein
MHAGGYVHPQVAAISYPNPLRIAHIAPLSKRVPPTVYGGERSFRYLMRRLRTALPQFSGADTTSTRPADKICGEPAKLFWKDNVDVQYVWRFVREHNSDLAARRLRP